MTEPSPVIDYLRLSAAQFAEANHISASRLQLLIEFLDFCEATPIVTEEYDGYFVHENIRNDTYKQLQYYLAIEWAKILQRERRASQVANLPVFGMFFRWVQVHDSASSVACQQQDLDAMIKISDIAADEYVKIFKFYSSNPRLSEYISL